MVLVLVGASHRDVTLDELARLSVGGSTLMSRLVESPHVAGAVLLSTCNRFEIYLDADRFHDGVDATTGAVADSSGLDRDFVVDAMRVTVRSSVAQHLFSVASGLESMVVGEDEIAGQVRHALAQAQQAGTVTPMLQRLFQHALTTSKAVSRLTGLGAAGRSVVTVGLDLLEQRHGPVAARRALVLGTGSYARIVTAALHRRGCRDVEVYSSTGRAASFAASHHVTAVGPDDLPTALARADLVAACSGAAEPVVDARLLAEARPGGGPLLVLDLALSADVAADARDLPGVDVVDLALIHANVPREHSAAVLQAQDVVLDAVASFEHAEDGRGADHLVVAMRLHVREIIDQEVERIRRRVDAATAEEVAHSLDRVAGAILHVPTVRAQQLARSGDVDAYQRAVHTLFGIDVNRVPGA